MSTTDKNKMKLFEELMKVFDDELFKDTEKSIEDFLNEDRKKELEVASDLMNKKIEEAMKKVQNKERKILIDSPMKVEGEKKMDKCDCKCGCGCTEKEKVKLNVANAIKADSLKVEPKVEPKKEKSKVKLININKTAEKMLSEIYEDIKSNRDLGYLEYDFLDEDFNDYLENVRYVTIEKLLNRIADHLSENGFGVGLSISYDGDEMDEAFLTITW